MWHEEIPHEALGAVDILGALPIGWLLVFGLAPPRPEMGAAPPTESCRRRAYAASGRRSFCRKRRIWPGGSRSFGSRSKPGGGIAGGSRMSSRHWTGRSGSTVHSPSRGAGPNDSTDVDPCPASPGRRRGSRCRRRGHPGRVRRRTTWGTSARGIRRSPGRGRGNVDRLRDDRYTEELETRITLGQFSAIEIAARLDAEVRRLQHRRDEAGDLRNRIVARYAELSRDPAVMDALTAINGTGTATATLGRVAVGTEELRQIDASLGRATAPPLDAAGRLELKGPIHLRALVGAADLLLHEVAIDAALATLEHDRISRRRLLAEQTLKNPRRSESLHAPEAGRGPSDRPPTGAGNVRTRTESLLSEQAQARKVTNEVLERLAAHQGRFLQIVAAARAAVNEIDQSRDGPRGIASARTSGAANARPATSSQDPASSPYVRRLKELETLIRSETIAVNPDKGLVWVDATIDGNHRLKLIVEPESDVVRLSADTAADAGIRLAEDSPTVEVATLDGRKFAAQRPGWRPCRSGRTSFMTSSASSSRRVRRRAGFVGEFSAALCAGRSEERHHVAARRSRSSRSCHPAARADALRAVPGGDQRESRAKTR